MGVKGAIKQFIDEFVSNAPEYKGMDKGLAIAKIGFAMVPGRESKRDNKYCKGFIGWSRYVY